jgi:SAM-dependent methyltransferase
MREESNERSEIIQEFAEQLRRTLFASTFVRLVLSPRAPSPGGPEKVIGRLVDIKGQPHLSLTLRYSTRDETRNLPIKAAPNWVRERLGPEFHSALLCTTEGDWQLSLPNRRRARLIRHKASIQTVPGREHDRPRAALLDESAHDWLSGLGVTDSRGNVRPSMGSKLTQINRYLEIFSHMAKDADRAPSEIRSGAPTDPTPAKSLDEPEAPGPTIVDMGCGKGYLTFGLWHLWHRVWKRSARIVGVEARSELVDTCNRLAKKLGAHGLEFRHGTIESMDLPKADTLIALHACDVATDAAIARGIALGSQLILVAPCCQKEVRPQLGHPEPLTAVLRHGVMQERMAEWVTDGLRALFLEWAGYRTKVFEFVSSEHTPKNLMIAATREEAPFLDPSARARIIELKRFFGIEKHSLDPLLDKS